ncbi:MAG TPA: GntR family transcriptional regulator [Pseudolysinimonas sp.]|nr:GntR family transcriptional regulator [Pseudolysinimonas sp.]
MKLTATTAAELREQLVAAGLPAGTKLPTVRALAAELGLAVNTVAKAYRELEDAGVIETRGRNGSFIALSADGAERALQEAAGAYAARAASLGIDAARALEYVRAALPLAE